MECLELLDFVLVPLVDLLLDSLASVLVPKDNVLCQGKFTLEPNFTAMPLCFLEKCFGIASYDNLSWHIPQ